MKLDAQHIAEIDKQNQLADILALPHHLRDATFRVDAANLSLEESPRGLVVTGMGGSAIGGSLATVALGDRAVRRIVVQRDYALPPWITPQATVLCVSYSGNTEETLACYEAAGAVGAQRVVVTTGGELAKAARDENVPVIGLPAGLQPRAAVGYMLVAALEVAAACGVGPLLRSEIDVAAAHAEQLVSEWGPEGDDNCLGKKLAKDLHGAIPVIVGAGLTAPLAYRWKTQINENAKVPCYSSELPEFDHNEIVGYEGASDLGKFATVFLDDSDLHPRVRERIDLTAKLIKGDSSKTFRVETVGQSSTERVVSLILLGDLISLYLAVLCGVDPMPVAVIEKLKKSLAK